MASEATPLEAVLSAALAAEQARYVALLRAHVVAVEELARLRAEVAALKGEP